MEAVATVLRDHTQMQGARSSLLPPLSTRSLSSFILLSHLFSAGHPAFIAGGQSGPELGVWFYKEGEARIDLSHVVQSILPESSALESQPHARR